MLPDPIGCTDGCGRSQPDLDALAAAGWTCLPISSRWRCPVCSRELVEANKAAPLKTGGA